MPELLHATASAIAELGELFLTAEQINVTLGEYIPATSHGKSGETEHTVSLDSHCSVPKTIWARIGR